MSAAKTKWLALALWVSAMATVGWGINNPAGDIQPLGGTAGGAVTNGNVTTDLVLPAGGKLIYTGRSTLQSTADGFMMFQNNAATGFTGLRLGGNTASFPMLGASGTTLQCRLADNSADAPFTAAAITASGAIVGNSNLTVVQNANIGGSLVMNGNFTLTGSGYQVGMGNNVMLSTRGVSSRLYLLGTGPFNFADFTANSINASGGTFLGGTFGSSVTNPMYSISTASTRNAGMWSPAGDTLAFATNGVNALVLDATQNANIIGSATVNGNTTTAAASSTGWTGRVQLLSPANGQLRVTNTTDTGPTTLVSGIIIGTAAGTGASLVYDSSYGIRSMNVNQSANSGFSASTFALTNNNTNVVIGIGPGAGTETGIGFPTLTSMRLTTNGTQALGFDTAQNANFTANVVVNGNITGTTFSPQGLKRASINATLPAGPLDSYWSDTFESYSVPNVYYVNATGGAVITEGANSNIQPPLGAGSLQMRTTASTDGIGISLGYNSYPGRYAKTRFRAGFWLTQLSSSGGDAFTFAVGQTNGLPDPSRSVTYVKYTDTVNSGKWQMVFNNGGSTADTTIAAVANHYYVVDVTTTNSSPDTGSNPCTWTFTDVTGATSATGTANTAAPKTAGPTSPLGANMKKTAGSGAVNAYLGFWEFWGLN